MAHLHESPGHAWTLVYLARKAPRTLAALQIVVLLVLIVINGLLSMSELAIVSARTSRLQQRAADGVRGARDSIALAEHPARFLSAVQIGITLIGIVTGVFGGAMLSRPLASAMDGVPLLGEYRQTISVVIVVAIITYLSLVIGELVPKRIALQQAENVACLVAPAMTVLSRIATPLVNLLAWSNEQVVQLLGIRANDEPEVTEEEIELMLRQGAEAGVFEEAERRMVAGVFDIADRSASELMTPRHQVAFLDLSRPEADNLAIMAEAQHSMYPVCEGSTDNVVGVVKARELWTRHLAGRSTSIRDAMVPALFVPEIAAIPGVIDRMRHSHTSMAVVVDEFGGIEGVLTLNDVLSDVVGEIDDQGRTNLKGGVQRDDGSWLLDGVFPAHEFRELMQIDRLPGEEEGHFETIAGFILDQLGHIPSAGEVIVWDGWTFEVMDMDGVRIDKVLASRRDPGDREADLG